MIQKLIFLFIFLSISFNSIAQTDKTSWSLELVNLKDSQVVDMVNAYIKKDYKKVSKLFPNYKLYLKPLDSIRLFAKAKKFAMRPNFLSSRQTEKTDIVLAMSNDKYEVIGFVVIFTSNKLDSQIESIRRDRKLDQKPDKEEEIKEL